MPMKKSKCLYCGGAIASGDYHEKCSAIFFGANTPPLLDYSLSEMAKLAKKIVQSSVTVPGVQPKLSLGIISKALKNKDIGRLTIMGALGGDFILKPPTNQFPDMPENEFITMHLAKMCGIRTVPFALIRLKSGELAYITRRIDRTLSGKKLHQLDMFQITEAFDKYRSSIEKVGKAVKAHSVNTLLDLLRLFELIVFCFITGNNDMHLKNFSLIHTNGWELAPAYDLLNVYLHLPGDREETALTIGGKKQKLSKTDFEKMGLNFGLNEKQIANTIARFQKKKPEMIKMIQHSFLSAKKKSLYVEMLKTRMNVFK